MGDTFEALEAACDKLNAARDKANLLIQGYNKAFADLNVGFQVFPDLPDEDLLCYSKEDGEWQLCLTTRNAAPRPLLQAPFVLRLKALRDIPDLLRLMITLAHEAADVLEADLQSFWNKKEA